MEKNREAGTWSSAATVEDIQKRLTRPPLHSQPWRDRINSQTPSKFNVNSQAQLMKKKKKMQVTRICKLDDYLHPVLLSEAREKISSNRKNHQGAEMKTTIKCEVREFDLFRWPGDGGDRNALTRGSTANLKDEDGIEAVDLSKD